jgi:hypothetical protein
MTMWRLTTTIIWISLKGHLHGRIIDHGGGAEGDGGWGLLVNNYQNAQNLRQSIKTGSSGYGVFSDINSIILNTWQHVAVTWNPELLLSM